MKVKFLFLLFSLIITFSQTNYFELKALRKSDIEVVEAKFKSTLIKETTTPKYEKDVKLVTEFEREKIGNFPAATVMYKSSPKDSLVEVIVFYWELNIIRKQSQAKKVEKYNAEFDKLILAISSELGNPLSGQGKLEQVESIVSDDPTPNYQRKVIWKKNNKVITASIIWAENHGEQMITSIK